MATNVMFGSTVRAVKDASGNVTGLSAGGEALDDSVLPAHVPDARFILENTAGIYQQTGVARAITNIASRISKNIWYVSSEATNGFVVGDDANSGASKALAKLTLESAFGAAAAGDTIIINDSTTPYDSDFYIIDKTITILPWTARGVTLRSTNVSFTFRLTGNDITFGAVIIDTNGVSASALRSNVGPTNNLRLIGTKLIGHSTYHLYTIGTVQMLAGFETELATTTSTRIEILSNTAGDVVIDNATIRGRVTITPTVAGVNVTVSNSTIRSEATGQADLLRMTGVQSLLCENNDIGANNSTDARGIVVMPHATFPTESVIIRNNRVHHSVGSAAISGYGIAVGNETTIAEKIASVEIYENEILHANHGLFAGYGIASGYSRGNVIRDTVIGCISKGNTCGFTHYANIIIGGTLTGGALRVKTSSNAKFYNNLVIFDAQSVAGGKAMLSSDTGLFSEYRNNIVYAKGLLLSTAVSIEAGNTATFNDNDYYADSYGATTFSYNGTTYASVALWKAAVESTALGVDPLFTGTSEWTLSAGSPCRGVGTQVISTDFMGIAMTNSLGPFA